MQDDELAAGDEDATATSTHVIIRPGQGAPAPNELTSSADEAEDDEEEEAYLAMGVVKADPLIPGCWAVIHGLKNQQHLNGLLVRVCSWERPTWWQDIATASTPANDDRLHVQLVEGPSRSTNPQLRIKSTNLQAVRAEEGRWRPARSYLLITTQLLSMLSPDCVLTHRLQRACCSPGARERRGRACHRCGRGGGGGSG